MSNLRPAPLGYKWVVRYTCRDGKRGYGLADHHEFIVPMISGLLHQGARDIVITDETFYKDEYGQSRAAMD